MDAEMAICVVVDKSRKILHGLDSETTAEDVINMLITPCRKQGPQVLLEVWNGCSRALPAEERVCLLLEQWGNQARNVSLVMMSAAKYCRLRGPRKTKISRAQNHGKVSARKRRFRRSSWSYRSVKREIQRLLEAVKAQMEKVQRLVSPKSSEDKALESSLVPLTPGEEEECEGVREEMGEERRENSELLRRRAELRGRASAQEKEMEALRKTISRLEDKISSEERQVARAVEPEKSPEAGEAQKELGRLQNELKVRTKLNQLQSSKMQELSSSISKTEQEIHDCTRQIEQLKFESHMTTLDEN